MVTGYNAWVTIRVTISTDPLEKAKHHAHRPDRIILSEGDVRKKWDRNDDPTRDFTPRKPRVLRQSAKCLSPKSFEACLIYKPAPVGGQGGI
jgi:hypothetical protein